MIGIYKIENLVNHKVYIGQSNNIERRFKEHQQKGAASRIPLDAAIQKICQYIKKEREDGLIFEPVSTIP